MPKFETPTGAPVLPTSFALETLKRGTDLTHSFLGRAEQATAGSSLELPTSYVADRVRSVIPEPTPPVEDDDV